MQYSLCGRNLKYKVSIPLFCVYYSEKPSPLVTDVNIRHLLMEVASFSLISLYACCGWFFVGYYANCGPRVAPTMHWGKTALKA